MMNFFRNFYLGLNAIGSFIQPFLLLALRLYWGTSFFLAGLGKLQNIPHVAGFFENLHIPFPVFNAYVVSFFECVGGFCLLIGLGARLMAIPLSVIMITALLTSAQDALLMAVENPHELINQTPFSYLLVCLIILAFGAGLFSIDYLIEKFVLRTGKRQN